MIVDTLSNTRPYYALHPRLEEAFRYVLQHLDQKEEGTHAIDGDKLYVIFTEGRLKAREEVFLEAHDRYIDIQVCLDGDETFGWRSRRRCFTPQRAYDPEKDLIFYDDEPSSFISLTPQEFVIFFPDDAHAPLIGEGRTMKAIVKVAVDE